MNFIINIYRFIFCRNVFYRFNYHLYRIALRGIGILNSEGNNVTGEFSFLKRLNRKYVLKTVFDVGANTGEYTTAVLSNSLQVQVYSFEPHPKTFKKLKNNIKNDNVFMYNVALGRHTKNVKLWDFADDAKLKNTQPTSTLASLQKNVIEGLHQQKSVGYSVKVITLDDFVKAENIDKISLLKIDTEGTEYDVLLGAKETLKRGNIDIIQFEFNEMNVYSRVFLKDFVDLLQDFTFYRLMPNGLYPLGEYRPSTWEIFAFQNIVAVHKSVKQRIIE